MTAFRTASSQVFTHRIRFVNSVISSPWSSHLEQQKPTYHKSRLNQVFPPSQSQFTFDIFFFAPQSIAQPRTTHSTPQESFNRSQARYPVQSIPLQFHSVSSARKPRKPVTIISPLFPESKRPILAP
ncbi:hypothetical protein M405DRAFT_505239 [Rhizopogon salebrosus TDB-379]|nr:hypothetical protein M405DRAFT_505239 [Rhizopogon salebrosus TDB-379]